MSFLSSLKESFSSEKLSELSNFIKTKIIEQAKTQLAGVDKKSNVDSAVIAFIKTNIISANPLVSALINILIDYVPVLTQCIYDYLKKRVDGLTEEV